MSSHIRRNHVGKKTLEEGLSFPCDVSAAAAFERMFSFYKTRQCRYRESDAKQEGLPCYFCDEQEILVDSGFMGSELLSDNGDMIFAAAAAIDDMDAKPDRQGVYEKLIPFGYICMNAGYAFIFAVTIIHLVSPLFGVSFDTEALSFVIALISMIPLISPLSNIGMVHKAKRLSLKYIGDCGDYTGFEQSVLSYRVLMKSKSEYLECTSEMKAMSIFGLAFLFANIYIIG